MAAGGDTQRDGRLELGYRAFLLRCWQEAGAGPDGEPAWRFRLMEPGDQGTSRGFANLEGLVAFLRQELARDDPRSNQVETG